MTPWTSGGRRRGRGRAGPPAARASGPTSSSGPAAGSWPNAVPAQAAMYLERALAPGARQELDPRGAGALVLRSGRHDRAAQEFDELLCRRPANDYAHFALARCLLKLGDVAGARRERAPGGGHGARQRRVPARARRLPRGRLARDGDPGGESARARRGLRARLGAVGEGVGAGVRHGQQDGDALLDGRVRVEQAGRLLDLLALERVGDVEVRRGPGWRPATSAGRRRSSAGRAPVRAGCA